MIKTKRLVIKRLKQKDSKKILEIINEREIKRFMSHINFPFKEKDAKVLIKGKHDSLIFGIYLKKELIGIIDLYKIRTDRAKIGYMIKKEERNRGYAFESLSFLLPFLYKKNKIKKVTARVSSKNTHSIKILKKLGFKLLEKIKENNKIYFRFNLINP